MLPIEDGEDADFARCAYCDIERRRRQDPNPFDFASKVLDVFIPGPGKAIQTSILFCLSRLTVEMQNDYWDYGLQTMGFTMSAKEFKDEHIPFTGQKFMDTDDLDWNDREEIQKAYLNTIKPYRLRKEAARAVGDGPIGTTAGATAIVMSAVMWLIAGHCPQLTSSVTTWILPDEGAEEAFLGCWLSHLTF